MFTQTDIKEETRLRKREKCNFHFKIITILTCEYNIAQIPTYYKVNSPEFTPSRQQFLLKLVDGIFADRWQHGHNPLYQTGISHSFSCSQGNGCQRHQSSGEEGGNYIIFTGKYGNINFKMKITYPTSPCEYNTARFPTLNRRKELYATIITGEYPKD